MALSTRLVQLPPKMIAKNLPLGILENQPKPFCIHHNTVFALTIKPYFHHSKTVLEFDINGIDYLVIAKAMLGHNNLWLYPVVACGHEVQHDCDIIALLHELRNQRSKMTSAGWRIKTILDYDLSSKTLYQWSNKLLRSSYKYAEQIFVPFSVFRLLHMSAQFSWRFSWK